MCSGLQFLFNYYLATLPKAVSFGLIARASGPRTAAKAAVKRSLGSVWPAMYIAATAETAVRRYEAATACNCLFI